MAKRKSKKKKGGALQAANQSRETLVMEDESGDNESDVMEEENVLDEGLVETTARDKEAKEPSASSTSTKSRDQQTASSKPEAADLSDRQSDIGGIIVVVVIFSIIGLAVLSQILLN